MLEHILIAYDGSGAAERALEAGARVARGTGAAVTLFHVRLQGPIPETIRAHGENAPDPEESHSLGGFYDAASLHPQDLDQIGSRLLEQARSVLDSYGLNNVQIVQRAGDAASEILDHARSNGVDTLVVGTRGHGQFSEMVLGSVSHKLQHAFKGCVMTVH